ncbi:X-box-binding protein 1 [Halocaridina rubra]|uniref:X-box-binding protein 1 n=1 Tax=Halocaridina rubra TaxID=373956 RepID=A0AAN8WVA6_HALRR
MATTKTIVITIPKELGRTPLVLPTPSHTTAAIATRQLSEILSGNFVQVIKEEDDDSIMHDATKPPRKRQRLDHLTIEEKVMRRKLKNRVAAQTARDRKKLRMDQLEAQVAELTEHIGELNELTAILTEQNTQLVEKNEALQVAVSKCTCSSVSNRLDEGAITKTHNNIVYEGVEIPVSTQIVGSAASIPQQRAVRVLAVVRILVLNALCYQWANAALQTLLKSALNSIFLSHTLIKPSQKSISWNYKSNRWWGPHQQSWNPVGT